MLKLFPDLLSLHLVTFLNVFFFFIGYAKAVYGEGAIGLPISDMQLHG